MAKNTKNLTEWTMKDFSEYFSGSKRLFGNSETFDEISGLSKELTELEGEDISYRMWNERTEKLQELIDTAVEYDENHVNPRTSTGKERKEVINAFKAFCENEKAYAESVPSVNLKFFDGDNLQNLKEGVSYEHLKKLEAKLEEIRGKELSEDNVIEYTNTISKYLQGIEIYQKNPQEVSPLASGNENKNIISQFQANADFYKPFLDQMRDLRTVRAMIKEKKSWDDFHALREATAEMTGKEEKVGANVNQRFKITHNGKTGFFTEENYAKAGTSVFEEYIAEHHETKEDIIIGKNIKFLKDNLATLDPQFVSFTNLENKLRAEMDKLDRTSKEGQERYQACQELMNNPKAKGEVLNLWKKAAGINLAYTFSTGEVELTSRNVATSRLAELLGVGTLIAHSEKMTVDVNGKSVSGCFMEFAEGVDVRNTKEMYELSKFSNISVEAGGSFSKDASNLQLFDVICGQKDRHAGNLFVKLGEPDEKGVRKVVGLQGIDNDLAFFSSTNIKADGKSPINNITFVDGAFARNVEALTKEKIEYAVGDLLNSTEIDRLMMRLERVKTHIKENAIKLETENDWKLDKYSADMDISKLDEKEQKYAKKYIDAVTDIKRSFNKHETEFHNERKVAYEFQERSKDYEKMLKEETELLGDVSNMFEQAEKEANVSEKKQPAAANRPKERMSFKDLADKKEKKPAFKTAQPSQNQKEKKSVVIGANRGMGKK